jgi:hypothetical protein
MRHCLFWAIAFLSELKNAPKWVEESEYL